MLAPSETDDATTALVVSKVDEIDSSVVARSASDCVVGIGGSGRGPELRMPSIDTRIASSDDPDDERPVQRRIVPETLLRPSSIVIRELDRRIVD